MITNKLGGAILVGVGMLICPLRSHAATLGCPAFPTPKIEISVDPPDDRTITTKSLDQMHAAGKIRHPAPVVGVYLGALQYGIQIDDTVRQAGAGRFCATPKYVTLKLGLERIIYIPHEFADDPCLSSLAHDHEAKHADSDIKAFEIARPALESAVRMAVSRATTEAAASRTEALATLTLAIQSDVNHAIDDMATLRERLDAEVDSPAELERLKTACGGRAALQLEDTTVSQ